MWCYGCCFRKEQNETLVRCSTGTTLHHFTWLREWTGVGIGGRPIITLASCRMARGGENLLAATADLISLGFGSNETNVDITATDLSVITQLHFTTNISAIVNSCFPAGCMQLWLMGKLDTRSFTIPVHADWVTGFGDLNPGFDSFDQTPVFQTEHYTLTYDGYRASEVDLQGYVICCSGQQQCRGAHCCPALRS